MRKKAFATIASALFISSSISINAQIQILDDPDAATCFTQADREARVQGFLQGWTHEEEHRAFLALYDSCMSGGNQQLTQI